MAKSYQVLSGAWSRTKTGDTIYLSPQNQDDLPHLLTKARLKELVAGSVLKEFGYDDPEPEEAEDETPAGKAEARASEPTAGATRSSRKKES